MLGVFCEEDADCELSWEKARTEEELSVTASGDILERACGLEARIKPEAVEAARRVCDAIVGVDCGDDGDEELR